MLSKLLRISKDSLIYSLRGFAQSFIGIFLVPIYTRIFSPSDYGVIDLITTIIIFLNMILTMGLDNSVTRYYVDSKDEKDKKMTASTGLIYGAFSSFIVTFILILLSPKLSNIILGNSISYVILMIALITLPINIISLYCLGLLRMKFQSLLFVITAIGEMILGVSLTIYLVVFRRVGIIGIYIAQMINFTTFSIIRFYLTRTSFGFVFSFKRLKELMAFGAPTIPLSTAHYVMTYTNRYFLKYYSGLNAVGLYGIGFRVSSLISLIVAGFQFAWGPFVLSTYNDVNAKETFSKIYDYFAIIVCLAVLALSLYSKEVLTIFATREYMEAYKTVPFISTSIVTYTLGGYFAIGISIAKKTWHYIWISVVVSVINIILNVFLIKYLGLVGSVISLVLSFIVLGFLLMKVSQRYYPIEFHFYRHFIMYFIAGLIIFVVYKFMPTNLSLMVSITAKASLVIIFIIVPFALKLIGRIEIEYIRILFEKFKK
jgi:O-antigen/teichoic acid export membrane protein